MFDHLVPSAVLEGHGIYRMMSLDEGSRSLELDFESLSFCCSLSVLCMAEVFSTSFLLWLPATLPALPLWSKIASDVEGDWETSDHRVR